MRKMKVYLDTSVISYLQQEDVPERMKERNISPLEADIMKPSALLGDEE